MNEEKNSVADEMVLRLVSHAVFGRYRSVGWYIPTVEGDYAFHVVG